MITVVGEALVDLVRAPGGPVVAHPGGSPANVAVGLARLGVPVGLVARYGADAYGDLLDAHFAHNGVTMLGEARTATATSVAEATLDATGAATYDFRISWDLGDGDVALAEGTTCVHTGSIGATVEPGASAVRALVDRVHEDVTVSYDPNCRPSLMGSPDAARTTVEGLVARSHVVKVSDEDLGWLYPGRDHADVAKDWLDLGPSVVVVTRGSGGSWGLTRTAQVSKAPVRITVADTVGAGDAFMAGLLDGLYRRELLGPAGAQRLRNLDEEDLAGVLDEAGVVAAITCSRPGANPPTALEVADFRQGARRS